MVDHDDAVLESAAERLAEQFHEDRPSVERRLHATAAKFRGARVQTFVPILTERFVRSELRASHR